MSYSEYDYEPEICVDRKTGEEYIIQLNGTRKYLSEF